jgi:hypothetical protein
MLQLSSAAKKSKISKRGCPVLKMSSGIVSGLLPNYPTTVPMSVSEQHRTVCTDVAK